MVVTVMPGSGSADTGLQPAHSPMVISSSARVFTVLLLGPERHSDGGSGEHHAEINRERGEGVGDHQSGSSHGRVAA